MNKDILKYGFLILLLPVLQEVLFNHINLFGFVNPMIYVVFVFVFPVYKSKTSILWASFILGVFIDMLTNEGGIHTFSLVFVSYYRLFILRFIKGNSIGDEESIDILLLLILKRDSYPFPFRNTFFHARPSGRGSIFRLIRMLS